MMDDEAAVATIASVRGLGPWTAEVYLLFALGRPDIFPAGDLALAGRRRRDLRGLPARPIPARRCGGWRRSGNLGAAWRRGCCGTTGGTSPAARRWTIFPTA